jgi:predicted MFS family arabinose efflux permease
VLIPVAGWQAVFLVQVPVAVLTLILAFVALPPDMARAKKEPVEGYPAAWERALLSNLSLNLLVAAVMMATLVVGPFYLGRGLGLSALSIGLVMSFGPLISILSGIPSGRVVDVWGTRRILALGLILLAAGSFLLAVLPMMMGVAGYIVAIAMLTPGYQLFQAANNTQVMTNIPKQRRGVISGLLGLSRNLGLIVGASVMGAVFAWGAGTRDISQAPVPAIASGMQLTFLIAAGLMLAALWLALGTVRRGRDRPASGDGKGPL